jgi:hypothetical protein
VQPPVDATAELPVVSSRRPADRARPVRRRHARDEVPLDEEIFGLGEDGER